MLSLKRGDVLSPYGYRSLEIDGIIYSNTVPDLTP